MEAINFFESIDFLEKQKCPNCGSDIDYGLTTTYSDKNKAHLCNECGKILK
jgi:ribosomal protein S27AE